MSIVLFTSSLFKEMKSGFVGDNQITDLSCLADLELNGCLRKDQVSHRFRTPWVILSSVLCSRVSIPKKVVKNNTCEDYILAAFGAHLYRCCQYSPDRCENACK